MLRDGPVLVLGGGSNLLFAGDPAGAVLALTGQRVAHRSRTTARTRIVRADAGVEWHGFVLLDARRTACAGLENLALIPGTVGAAPIQNIGAYGVEVREFIHAVEAFERGTGQLHRARRATTARSPTATACSSARRIAASSPRSSSPAAHAAR